MPTRTEPEMLRTELQATCLQAKALVPSAPVADTLRLAMDPPSDELMSLATSRLERLGAFAPAPILNALNDDEDDTTEVGMGACLGFPNRIVFRLDILNYRRACFLVTHSNCWMAVKSTCTRSPS